MNTPNRPDLFKLVETVLNRYLALDTEMSSELEQLAGKCIGVELSSPELQLYLLPSSQQIQIERDFPIAADVTVRSSAGGLLGLLRSKNPVAALSSGDVEIEGDTDVAEKFAKILGAVDADWEQALSQYTGSLFATRFGNFVGSTKQWLSQSSNNFLQDSADYLKEESGVLPTRVEFERLVQQNDSLRDDTDRLEARIRRLERGRTT